MRPKFSLVLNPFEMSAKLPVELVPGHILRRAASEEVTRIKHETERWNPVSAGLGKFTNFYEGCWVQTTDDGSGKSFYLMEPESWRYFIIDIRDTTAFGGVNLGLHAIEAASRLSRTEIKCSVWFSDDPGVGWQNYPQHFYQEAFYGEEVEFTDDDAKLIRNIDEQLRVLKSEPVNKDIDRSLGMFGQLDMVDPDHSLYVLGLFAVIESLLTHNPKGEYDSLGHQIRTKMNLLSDRFQESIDYGPFGKHPSDTIWTKLYECRSKIAHGGPLEFTGSLQILKNLAVVGAFLRSTTKKLLRQALVEPKLLRSLRAC